MIIFGGYFMSGAAQLAVILIPMAALVVLLGYFIVHRPLGALIAQVVAALESQLGFTVYWVGRNIRKKADFEAADLSARSDVSAIFDSRYFLSLYPAKIASSVLFEAGIALRECLTSIYFMRARDHLPFLMTQASQAFPNVRTYEGESPQDLIVLLQKHGKSFFDPLRSNSDI